jgi:hypothetical protein
MDQDDRLKTNGFMRAKISFTNGYGASVIFGPMIRDFEVAVLKGEYLCYDTPIAEDVIAGLDLTEVTEVLRRIESL